MQYGPQTQDLLSESSDNSILDLEVVEVEDDELVDILNFHRELAGENESDSEEEHRTPIVKTTSWYEDELNEIDENIVS